MKTKGHGGRKLKKSIRVTCDDPDNGNLTLTVEGDVKTFVSVEPSKLRMSGKLGQVNVQTVSITPTDDFDFKILEASFQRESDLTCKIDKKKEDKKNAYILTITNPNKKVGRFSDKLIVTTNHPQAPKIEIYVSGYVSEPPKTKDGKP